MHIQEHTQQRPVRRYGDRPAQTRVERQYVISVQRNLAAVEQAIRGLGWRVYASNAPPERLSLAQAMLADCEAFLVERHFGRLKGKPLSLTPMYLQDDRRATGLTRLLLIGLRVLTLFEHGVRRQLAETGDKLSGLYAGNPKRATNRPTTEALLQVFQEISLSIVTLGVQVRRHITPLSDLQRRILDLLNISPSIYAGLAADSANPP